MDLFGAKLRICSACQKQCFCLQDYPPSFWLEIMLELHVVLAWGLFAVLDCWVFARLGRCGQGWIGAGGGDRVF